MLATENISPDFDLDPVRPISGYFTKLGINRFSEACKFIKELPYERNSDKTDPFCVLKDRRGTCSTKHVTLQLVAQENNFFDFKLVIGLFKMNSKNTPAVSATLKKFGLDYIPEAHNYLKY